VNLAGMTVSNGTSSTTLTCQFLVPAGGFAVLGNNGDMATNGGVPVDCVYAGLSLVNTGGSLSISNGDTVNFGNLIWGTGNAFSLDPASQDAISNDNLANWCFNTTSVYGLGDFGTPGEANPSCP
jgi:hypothetical protein